MGSYLRPDDRWLIDWADDDFAHPYADVTGDYHSYYVRYGADTESNPSQIQLTKAQGILRLDDTNNRYDPGSINTDIDTSALRRPHTCRLEARQYVPFFDMTITPPAASAGFPASAYHRSHDPTRGHIPAGQNGQLFQLPGTSERYDLFTMTRENPGGVPDGHETLEINTGGGQRGQPNELPDYLMTLGWDWYMIVNGFYVPSSASVNPVSGREFEIRLDAVGATSFPTI